MELITVIIILGIVGIGITSFMRFGFSVYQDASIREALVSQSRFVVERLNRELRMVIPNSVRVNRVANDEACIEFVPIAESGSYLTLPTESLADEGELIAQNSNYQFQAGDWLVVYPLQSSDVYAGTGAKRHTLESYTLSNNKVDVAFNSAGVLFAAHSPQRRFYIGRGAVSYCFDALNRQLLRFDNYGVLVNQPTISTFTSAGIAGVLMAEGVSNNLVDNEVPFIFQTATLTTNALIELYLRFSGVKNELAGSIAEQAVTAESLFFYNQVHLPNVP